MVSTPGQWVGYLNRHVAYFEVGLNGALHTTVKAINLAAILASKWSRYRKSVWLTGKIRERQATERKKDFLMQWLLFPLRRIYWIIGPRHLGKTIKLRLFSTALRFFHQGRAASILGLDNCKRASAPHLSCPSLPFSPALSTRLLSFPPFCACCHHQERARIKPGLNIADRRIR